MTKPLVPNTKSDSARTESAVADPIPVGEFLSQELEARGWTQADFAAVLGRPIQFISEIINGRKEITLADVTVMPALVRMHDLGMPDWQDLPRIVTWFDNIRAQPAFQPTYYQGSLLSERFPHLREKLAKTA